MKTEIKVWLKVEVIQAIMLILKYILDEDGLNAFTTWNVISMQFKKSFFSWKDMSCILMQSDLLRSYRSLLHIKMDLLPS